MGSRLRGNDNSTVCGLNLTVLGLIRLTPSQRDTRANLVMAPHHDKSGASQAV